MTLALVIDSEGDDTSLKSSLGLWLPPCVSGWQEKWERRPR